MLVTRPRVCQFLLFSFDLPKNFNQFLAVKMAGGVRITQNKPPKEEAKPVEEEETEEKP